VIVFDLECRLARHRFEGWFGSSDDFAQQQQRGLVSCPQCGSGDVVKALMAPSIGRKGNQITAAPGADAQPMSGGKLSPEALTMMQAMASMQAEALKDSRWVGNGFAEQSRAMHYGEKDRESIHGEASREQAKALIEEGIDVAPLPFPVAPPEKAN
jgi:hypothetical protein